MIVLCPSGEVGLVGMYQWLRVSKGSDLALVDDGVPRVVLGAGTDPMAARYAGLPAVSIASWADGGFTNYHLPTDTADRVNWESVERCVELATETVDRWTGAHAGGG